MFEVFGDTIYYNGREFAAITATNLNAGGWVIDAREELDRHASITLDEFDAFVKAFTKDINQRIEKCLERQAESLWWPPAVVDQLDGVAEALIDEIGVSLRDESLDNMGVRIDG